MGFGYAFFYFKPFIYLCMSLNHSMKFYLLIYIKRYKLTSEKKSPLFLRISVNGKRVEIALKRTISPDLWDNKRQCVKGRSLEAQSINEQIRVENPKTLIIKIRLSVTTKWIDNQQVSWSIKTGKAWS